MGEAAAFISAISALVAVITVIIIHFQSRSLMRRIERPVISLDSTNVRVPMLHTMRLELCFKNIGRNPAIGVSVYMFGCCKEQSLMVEEIDRVHIVNQKDPGISFFWYVELNLSDYINPVNFLFYISLIYQDIFTKKHYSNELWLIHKKGEPKLKDMDIRDCRKMRKEMKNILFYRVKHKNL